jgi:ABC-2 type transport system permease protein
MSSASKFREVARFELTYQLRRYSTWILSGLFLLPLIGITLDELKASADRTVLFTSPLFVAEGMVVMGIVAMMIMAVIVGDAATRDVQTRIEPLVNAAPVTRAAYVGGQFAGAFLLSAMILAVIPIVKVAGALIHPGVDAAVIGHIRPVAYLEAYFLMLLPNALLATALMFAFASKARHAAGSYVAAALVFASAQLGVWVGETFGDSIFARLVEPTGFAALEFNGNTWSPLELNGSFLSSDGVLLLNRLIWTVLALALIALTVRRSELAGDAGALRWWQRLGRSPWRTVDAPRQSPSSDSEPAGFGRSLTAVLGSSRLPSPGRYATSAGPAAFARRSRSRATRCARF